MKTKRINGFMFKDNEYDLQDYYKKKYGTDLVIITVGMESMRGNRRGYNYNALIFMDIHK